MRYSGSEQVESGVSEALARAQRLHALQEEILDLERRLKAKVLGSQAQPKIGFIKSSLKLYEGSSANEQNRSDQK